MSMIEEKYKEILGKEIESKRTVKELGVRELAKLADIEHHQLINIEKGRVDVRLSTLLKIAKALDTQVKELLTF